MMMKGGTYVKGKPKKTRQGNSQYTLRSATSRNKAKKKYRGQGKQKQLHSFIMSALICNLPSVEVWVRKEYLTDHQSGHGEFVKGVWVSCKSIPGRTFYFETYLPEYAAMYDKLPISAFVSAPETPSPDMDLPNLQFWNCMDYGVVAVTKQFIGSMDYELYTRDFGIQKGTYICTIDNYHQDPEVVDYATSENPAEHKSHNLIELENGQYALYPNNRMRIYDNSLTPVEPKMPDFKVSTQYYQVENGFERLGMGREDEYFWKTSKERKIEEEKTEDMYKSQEGRPLDPQ